MEGSTGLVVGVSALLIVLNAFFVAAEYSLIGARRSRVEAMRRKGNRGAKRLLSALENISPLVAASQIGITMVGIGVGSVTEPFVTDWLVKLLGHTVPERVSFIVSFLLVAFVLVVMGELVPKYLALRHGERVALATHRLLELFSQVFRPIIALAQWVSSLFLRPFGIDPREEQSAGVVPKEELLMLVQTGFAEGVLEREHAEWVTRALKIDNLDAQDIMVHRLDVKWLDAGLDSKAVLEKIRGMPFTRIPVARGDIDDLLGIVYLHDIVVHMDDPDFSLEKIVRPLVAVPENLSLDKIVGQMRDNKTQMLVVMDEYGGTSGLITLEDVVEEVFGELEDRLESERPAIETLPNGRVSARADVRFDELLSKLQIELPSEASTETLATIIVNALGRVPRPGDSVPSEIGALRVENMARRRITRVSVYVDPKWTRKEDEGEG